MGNIGKSIGSSIGSSIGISITSSIGSSTGSSIGNSILGSKESIITSNVRSCIGRSIGNSVEQGWPTQLHHWANISAPILKRATKLLLMTNSHYFTSFSSNFLMNFLRTSYFPRYAILAKSLSPEMFPTSQQD